MFKKYKRNKEKRDAIKRDVFYYEKGDALYKYDPLQTYIRLKETGFDQFSNQLKGIMNGNPHLTKTFIENMKESFGVKSLEEDKNGFTVIELIDLYLQFFLFLDVLKKKHTLLADFAPSTVQALQELTTKKSEEQQDSEESAISSDSPSVSPPQPPQEESEPSTEQEPPLME